MPPMLRDHGDEDTPWSLKYVTLRTNGAIATIRINRPDLMNALNEKVIEQIEIELKYEGYIKRQYEMVEKMMKLEKINIPLSFNYNEIIQISTEGREKLSKTKPRTIGQASRISGVTPSDISILLVYLKK